MLGLGGSCNFDSAFERYCANNPRCADAGPDLGPKPGPEAGPEAGPEVGPEVGPETGPDLDPDVVSDLPWNFDRDGGPGGPPRGPVTPCASDSDCSRGGNDICHPIGKVCMVSCRSSTDCLGVGLDLCGDLPVPGGPPRKVCMCGSTTFCQTKFGPNFRCNNTEKLCEPACTTSDDCGMFRPSRVCDSNNQVCQRCASNVDCPSTQPHCDSVIGCVGCFADSDCTDVSLSQCNVSTGACVAPSP